MIELTEDQILEWIEGTSDKSEPPSVTKARFEKTFGLGTPRDVYSKMERSFSLAMVRWHIKKSASNK